MSNLSHKLSYVNWRKEAKLINVTHKEFEERLKWFENNGHKPKSKTKRSEWLHKGAYNLDMKGNYKTLYCKEQNGQYIIYTTHSIDDSKNTGVIINEGYEGMKLVSKKFKELNGVALHRAFGYSDSSIRGCAINPLYYVPDKKIVKAEHVGKVDFSSQFPSCACGDLPDWNTRIVLQGYHEPTEEYPFAYYPVSNHCAEYGVFNTKNFLKDYDIFSKPFYGDKKTCQRYNVPEAEEVTILCQKAKYSLTDVYEYFYDKKAEGDPDAKLVMNSSIGYMWRHKAGDTGSYRLYHIVAVIMGRAKKKILDLAAQIGTMFILQIAVDGIVYMGKREIGTKTKKLGALIQENTDCKYISIGCNQYMLANQQGEIVLVKHGGCNFAPATCFEDIHSWRKI